MKDKICIGVATRKRPQMFYRLLDSLVSLTRPDGVLLQFVFIENDDVLQINDAVKDFAEKLGQEEMVYADIETRLGIPVVRNRILDTALNLQSNYLASIDDDEIADANWLIGLYSEAQSRKLDLVGGVTRMEEFDANNLRTLQKLVYYDLRSRQEKFEKSSIDRHASGCDGAIKISTCNMLCRLDFIRRNQIWFDETLRFSHGEDHDFYLQVKDAGGKTGYAPSALVHEIVHVSRLSPHFQFNLSRNVARASYNIRYAQNKRRANREWVRSSFFVLGKTVLGCGRLLCSCFNRGRTFVRGLKGIAAAMGRLEAMLGAQDIHYKHTDGH